MDSFVIPSVSLPSEHLEEFAKAKLWLSVCQAQECRNNLFIRSRYWLVTINGSSQAGALTSAALAEAMLAAQGVGHFPTLVRRQSFFAMTSLRARFSNERSANICFKRRFSLSRSRSLRTSEGSMPPYLAFH